MMAYPYLGGFTEFHILSENELCEAGIERLKKVTRCVYKRTYDGLSVTLKKCLQDFRNHCAWCGLLQCSILSTHQNTYIIRTGNTTVFKIEFLCARI